METVNKTFLLDEDLKENRQFKFYVDDSLVKQENGTNPRIRRLSARTANEFMTISESLPDYEVRVINDIDQPPFRLSSIYEIEFSADEKLKYKAIDIRASYEQDLYVKIYIVKIQ